MPTDLNTNTYIQRGPDKHVNLLTKFNLSTSAQSGFKINVKV